MVVSDEELASSAGIEILKKGGNAVDAAVATAFALAVVLPAAGNIGGGGFMLIRMADGRAVFVDYRETAPGAASRNMYLRADGTLEADAAVSGYGAVAVPGTVAGLEMALEKFGTMKLADVMAPAIQLAEQGFAVSDKLVRSLTTSRPLLQRFSTSRRIFLNDGVLHKSGEILRQPELAATLHRIARNGGQEFYRGQTAREMVEEVRRMGGGITLEDLAAYAPKLREPLRGTYETNGAKWEVLTSPPPSSGGVAILEAMNILAPVELKSAGDSQTLHWIAEALRRAFADRAAYLGDADFTPVPVRGLTNPTYAAQLRATIDSGRASSSDVIRAGDPLPFNSGTTSGTEEEFLASGAEGNNTTHFSVVDAAGNAVANTYTLNNSYGSGVAVSAGFLLNDEMDDFATEPGKANRLYGLVQSEANAIAPGKRPLSSMMPTIVLRDGKLSFVTGSPGGPRIISAVLLSLLNWMRFGTDAQTAINAPRIHHQWKPDRLLVEITLSAETRAALERMGHTVVTRWQGDTGTSWIGQVEAIGIDAETGERLGAADPRRKGAALGY